MNTKEKRPRADASEQKSAAREPGKYPKRAQNDSTTHERLPITADTAHYSVQKLFEDRPKTMDRLARKAIEMRCRGYRVSIAGLCEWLQIESVNLTGNSSPFRVNNSIKAALARELMRRYPELDGAFETRRARCDEMTASNGEA